MSTNLWRVSSQLGVTIAADHPATANRSKHLIVTIVEQAQTDEPTRLAALISTHRFAPNYRHILRLRLVPSMPPSCWPLWCWKSVLLML